MPDAMITAVFAAVFRVLNTSMGPRSISPQRRSYPVPPPILHKRRTFFNDPSASDISIYAVCRVQLGKLRRFPGQNRQHTDYCRRVSTLARLALQNPFRLLQHAWRCWTYPHLRFIRLVKRRYLAFTRRRGRLLLNVSSVVTVRSRHV